MYPHELPLSEFYENCLSAAKNVGYEVVLCLVARAADAPNIYREVVQNWPSLHDLTGKSILFLFAGEFPDAESPRPGGVPDEIKSHNYFTRDLRVADARRSTFNEEFSRLLRCGQPEPPSEERLRRNQTLQVRNLMEVLRIDEEDIPCLHFTYLETDDRQVFPLGSLITELYPFLKELIRVWEDIFNKTEQLPQAKEKFLAGPQLAAANLRMGFRGRVPR